MTERIRKVCVNARPCRSFDRPKTVSRDVHQCPDCLEPLRVVDLALVSQKRRPRTLFLGAGTIALLVALRGPVIDAFARRAAVREAEVAQVNDTVILRSLKSAEEAAERVMGQLELRRRFAAVASLASARTSTDHGLDEQLLQQKTTEIELDIRRYQMLLRDLNRFPRDMVQRIANDLPTDATELDLLASSGSALFRAHLQEMIHGQFDPNDTARLNHEFQAMFTQTLSKRK